MNATGTRRREMKHWIILVAALALVCLLVVPNVCAAQAPKDAKTVALIMGLDGGAYEPYSPAVVEKVQSALKGKGMFRAT